MKILATLPFLTSCIFAVIFSTNALLCNPCEETQCPDTSACPAGTVTEPCGCCEVCAIPEGESCNTMEFGLCADGKFCLPDGGLSSTSVTGKCLGITECFSTGCDVVDDSCECGYSNSCPTKTFEFDNQAACDDSLSENSTEEIVPEECISYGCEIVESECYCIYSDICPVYIFSYPTEEDCEAAVNATSACEDVVCAQNSSCPIGAYYVPGPQLPGECCPSDGLCMCDEELCPEVLPACPVGSQLITLSANDTEDQCCDTYTCEKDLHCEFGDQIVENEALVSPDPCTHCKCSDGNLYCAVASCLHIECGPSEELAVAPGDCCPSCRPRIIIDPPRVPVCETEGEFVDPENPCKICSCYNGRTSCLEHSCEPIACERPVQLPGVCCSVCEETTTSPPTEETTVVAIPTATTTAEPTTVSETTTVKPTEVSTTIDEPRNQDTTAPPTEVSTTSAETTAPPTEVSTTIEIPTSPIEGVITTPVPTDAIVFPLPTLSITRPSSPYTPRRCSRQDMSYKGHEDACLTCACVNGVERCIDQTKTLCGVPQCKYPVMIQGECCPVCIDNGVHLLSEDKSKFVVSLVIDADLFDDDLLERLVQDELESMSYSLVDIRSITFGKAQVELVVVVEEVEKSEMPQEQLASALLQRLSTVSSTPTPHSSLRAHISDNIVIVVCALSLLMALILATVFGIFLVCVWITRINKRQIKNNTNSDSYDLPDKV